MTAAGRRVRAPGLQERGVCGSCWPGALTRPAWRTPHETCLLRERVHKSNTACHRRSKPGPEPRKKTNKRCGLLQLSVVEFLPIVKVVQIDGIARRGGVIRKAVRPENGFAGPVIVVVTANRGVELFDGAFVQFDAGLA